MNEHWDWLLACTHSICDKIDNIMQKRMSTIILETGKNGNKTDNYIPRTMMWKYSCKAKKKKEIHDK